MMNNKVASIGFLAILVISAMAMPASADDVLVGRAVLHAETFASGPTSGQFIGAGPINGVIPPFIDKQPVQGFSAVLKNADGSFYVMSDNGFGAQGNSQDYVLRIYEVQPDFETAVDGSGTIAVDGFISLHDPDGLIPFTIVADLEYYSAEGTAPKDNITSGIPVDHEIKEDRLLTGADFDIEAIQQVDDGSFWIGDEFGPFLLHVDADGKVLDSPVSLPNVSSPQNPYLGDPSEANLPRSRGFEGMALSVDGSKLYPMLEGALIDDPDQTRRIVNEFDISSKSYTGNQFYYRMENQSHAIGDFIAVNDHEYLVIERDGSQGDLNGFKKIFKIDSSNLDNDSFADKVEVVDLLNISDPDSISLPADPGDIGLGDPFAFPFVTIEDVVIIDPSTLGVLNDNNYPFSTGRNASEPDDNEFILIGLDEVLNVTADTNVNVSGSTELSANVVPAISITVETSALDFGTIGAGLSSATRQIRIANTGTHNVVVTAGIGVDEENFYAESIRLNGVVVGDFSEAIPADVTDFEYAEDITASLEVPEWAGGEYDGTVLFVAEGI